MNRVRLFAAAAVVGIVVLIASYYLFGGPLHLSLYFPITQSVVTKNDHVFMLPPQPSPPPLGGPLPKPTVTPTQRPHPSMRVPTRTDLLLHSSPRPITFTPTQMQVT